MYSDNLKIIGNLLRNWIYNKSNWEEAQNESSYDAFSRFLGRNSMCEGVLAKQASEKQPTIVSLPWNAKEQSDVAGTIKGK
jgi:hypothetical protein